jgi:hypothetical protein
VLNPEWLVAYTDFPGRYSVVRLAFPRWYYVFDHVLSDGACIFQSQSFQSITSGFPSSQIFSESFAEQAASVLQNVTSWFEPLPICEAPEYTPPPPTWLFGTSPETAHDPSTLIGFRVLGNSQQIAVLSFSKDGFFEDVEAQDDDSAIQAHEAFPLWSGFGEGDPTRQRFLP